MYFYKLPKSKKFLGYHKDCGGVIHSQTKSNRVKSGERHSRETTRCCSCRAENIHPDNILETRPDFTIQKKVGRRAKIRKYDITGWQSVKA